MATIVHYANGVTCDYVTWVWIDSDEPPVDVYSGRKVSSLCIEYNKKKVYDRKFFFYGAHRCTYVMVDRIVSFYSGFV